MAFLDKYLKKVTRMTEHEWLACTDPEQMMEFLVRSQEPGLHTYWRKARLFACACCWQVADLIANRQRIVND